MKNGSGVLTLSGYNNYSGSTTVLAGGTFGGTTVQLGAAGALPASTALTMNAGTGGMEFIRSGPAEPWRIVKPLQTRASDKRVDAVIRGFLTGYLKK